jgi:hypothetical protein
MFGLTEGKTRFRLFRSSVRKEHILITGANPGTRHAVPWC